MKKIVINNGYGGFGISEKAVLLLRELGLSKEESGTLNGEYYPDGSGPKQSYFTTNYPDITRDNPLLVQVVETLGKEADGDHACLKVVEIPDGVEWEIDEYDGWEHVAEIHRTWG